MPCKLRRDDEQFVGSALVDYFGGPACAKISEGEDPPDLYLELEQMRVGVEVTRLSQFTLESDGELGDRATQDMFGLRLVEALNEEIGPSLASDKSLLISLSLPVSNVRAFRKALSRFVRKIADAPADGSSEERIIEGSKVTISVTPRRASGKSVVGIIANHHSSADIGLNALLVLSDRIQVKSEICANLPKPIWLALFNDYWLADAQTYEIAAKQSQDSGCFERIFLISDTGRVHELTIGA